ncbi:queuine trna-ribosyltransferase [Cystoisospora suis]|uniref:Queuine trna-ribosyltransferase n=1 Tax=Cystoisospora suis TaxID=483139 RepID=A0A2C6KQL4_9APIC|nr:queuine trna-ribosyltransferase [Cystoisospora suis]
MELSSPLSIERIKPRAEEGVDKEEEESLSSFSSSPCPSYSSSAYSSVKTSLGALHADPFVRDYLLPSRQSLWRSLKQGDYSLAKEFTQNVINIPLRCPQSHLNLSSNSLTSSLSGVHTPETLEPSQVKFPKSLACSRKRAESSSTSSFPSSSSSRSFSSSSSISLSVEDELFLSSLGLLRHTRSSSSSVSHRGFPSGVCTPRLGVLSFNSKPISLTPCFALLTEKGFFPSCLLPPILRKDFSSLKLVDLPVGDFLSLHSVYESRYKSARRHYEALPGYGDLKNGPLQNREEVKKERDRREDGEDVEEEEEKKRTITNGSIEGRKEDREANEEEEGMITKRRRLSVEGDEEDIDVSRRTRREETEGHLLSSHSSSPPPPPSLRLSSSSFSFLPPVCDLDGFFLHLVTRDTQSCDKEGNIFPFKMKTFCPSSSSSLSFSFHKQKDLSMLRKDTGSSPAPPSSGNARREVKEEEKGEKEEESEQGRRTSSSSLPLLSSSSSSSPPLQLKKVQERKASRREGRDLTGVSVSTSSGRKSLLPSQLASLGLYMGVHLITSPSEELFLDEEVMKETATARRDMLVEGKRGGEKVTKTEERKKKEEEEEEKEKHVEGKEEESVCEMMNDTREKEETEEEHDGTMRKKKKNGEAKRREDGEKDDKEERRYTMARKKSSRIIDSAEYMLIDLIHSLTERLKEEHALSRVYVHSGEEQEGGENAEHCRNHRFPSPSLHFPHILANLQGGRSSYLREYVSDRIGKYLHSFSSSSSLISGVCIGGLGYSKDDRGECLEERYRLLCASLSSIPSQFPRFLPLQRSLRKVNEREEEKEEKEEKVLWPLHLLHAFCSGVDVVQGGEVYVHSEKGIAYAFNPSSLLSVYENEEEKEKDIEEEEYDRVKKREDEESHEILLKLAEILERRRRKWMRDREEHNGKEDEEEAEESSQERVHFFYRYLLTTLTEESRSSDKEEEKKIFSGVYARLLLEDAMECPECGALSLHLKDSRYQDDFRPLHSTGREDSLVRKKKKKQEMSESITKEKKRTETLERRNGVNSCVFQQKENKEGGRTLQGAQPPTHQEREKKEEEEEEEREGDLVCPSSSSCVSSSSLKESRGYIYHLYRCGEMIASSLVFQHNLRCLETLGKVFRLFLSRNELHRFVYRFLRRCCSVSSPSSSSSADTGGLISSSPL